MYEDIISLYRRHMCQAIKFIIAILQSRFYYTPKCPLLKYTKCNNVSPMLDIFRLRSFHYHDGTTRIKIWSTSSRSLVETVYNFEVECYPFHFAGTYSIILYLFTNRSLLTATLYLIVILLILKGNFTQNNIKYLSTSACNNLNKLQKANKIVIINVHEL